MKTYYLQEKVNNKWITREESNSREILVANQCLDYENIETRIIPATEIKLTEEEIFEELGKILKRGRNERYTRFAR